ncbi:MAG: hypothetical protein ACTSSC_12155, partial [Promethearchaeota archaeon]
SKFFEKTDPSWVTNSNIAVPPNPTWLRDTLIEYAEKNIEIYVPGHGNLCTKKHLLENAKFYDEYYIEKRL